MSSNTNKSENVKGYIHQGDYTIDIVDGKYVVMDGDIELYKSGSLNRCYSYIKKIDKEQQK